MADTKFETVAGQTDRRSNHAVAKNRTRLHVLKTK
jgi:hypothetical protein